MIEIKIKDAGGREIDNGDRVLYHNIHWLVDSMSCAPTGSSVEPLRSSRVVLLEITDRPLYRRRAVVDSPSLDQPQITVVDAGDVLKEICDGHV
jgi:hypothetical protein